MFLCFFHPVMSQQLLILEMFIITLVTRLLYRRQYEPISFSDSEEEKNVVSSAESSNHSVKKYWVSRLDVAITQSATQIYISIFFYLWTNCFFDRKIQYFFLSTSCIRSSTVAGLFKSLCRKIAMFYGLLLLLFNLFFTCSFFFCTEMLNKTTQNAAFSFIYSFLWKCLNVKVNCNL